MNMMQKFLVVCSLFTLPFVTKLAGQYPESSLPVMKLEEIIEETENAAEAEEIYQNLTDVLHDPLNINAITEADLQYLYFLNDFQKFSLLDYKRSFGDFLSLYELELVPGFDENLIKQITPFVYVDSPGNFSKDVINLRKPKHRLLLKAAIDYPLKKGFSQEPDSTLVFEGSPWQRLLKYEIRKEKIFKAGFTMESDAGEAFRFDTMRKGPDFFSAFLELENLGVFDKIVLGDFRLNSGHGLINGYGRNNKSSDVLFTQHYTGIKKYSSSAEYGFYRGIATEARFKSLRGTFYLSGVPASTSLSYLKDSIEFINTFYTNGLHRNSKENKLKHNARITNAGFCAGMQRRKWNLNLNYLATIFDKTRKVKYRPDRYSPSYFGKKFHQLSIDYTFRHKSFYSGGEFALDMRNKPAINQFLTASLNPLLSVSMGWRYYHFEYQSFHGASFSESTQLKNETGFYIGIAGYVCNLMKINIYFDRYKFPWLSYNLPMPGFGNDLLIKTEMKISSSTILTSTLKLEKKQISQKPKDTGIAYAVPSSTCRILLQADHEASERSSVRTRIEHKEYRDNHNRYTSNLIYQEVTTELWQDRLRLSFRYALFDVPTWPVRIYSWEHDVLYSFSVPVFYGNGTRAYLTSRIKISGKVDLWTKYAITSYTAEKLSGTGPDERKGSNFHELRIELILKL